MYIDKRVIIVYQNTPKITVENNNLLLFMLLQVKLIN